MKHIYEQRAYQQQVGSYWETTASPPRWPKLEKDLQVRVAIIGGGYTGLNCALELAEKQGVDGVAVLEANQPGWGASGRNGGFACMGGSKLGYGGHLRRFGETETIDYFKEQMASVESVRENLKRYKISADIHSKGETQLAHRERDVAGLLEERARLKVLLGIEATFMDKPSLADNGLSSPEFHGAMTNPVGFALNPMKYVTGLAQATGKAGLEAYGDTPALDLRQNGQCWIIETPGGTVAAENLVIATNGYSSENLPNWLAGRLLPVLTNIMVTRPLSPDELAAQGWTSHQMCYDTRNSLHYFHLLPQQPGEKGPRMLFGMRGGTSASQCAHASMRTRLRRDFDRFFPAWVSVETGYFWSGLACLTRDLTSFTGPIPGLANAFASLAYHGNGVAMGSHAGRLLGKMITGEIAPDALPAAMRQPPRKFPFPALRRTYLAAAYKWYEWKDG